MSNLARVETAELQRVASAADLVPIVVANAGDEATYRYIEFLTASIPNPNTRRAYSRALRDFFSWVEGNRLTLRTITPIAVAAYIKGHSGSPPTIKQHLAAIRQLFAHMTATGAIAFNPASSVKGPKYVTREGKTPVMSAAEARGFLDTIPPDTLIGLRDRAVFGVMVFTFARVGALVGLKVEDYYESRGRRHLRLHEKGGKVISVALNMKAAEYLHAWIEEAGLWSQRKTPLFRSIQYGQMQDGPLHTNNIWARAKRYARAAGLSEDLGNHSFRATGITVYLENGGTLEKAQYMAGHAKPETTKLYDRRREMETAGEVDKIAI